MVTRRIFITGFIILFFMFQANLVFASTTCQKMAFLKPLPYSSDETPIAEWNEFIQSLGPDHQAVITAPINGKTILEFLEASKGNSNFNRSLIAIAKYHGCFSLVKNRGAAIDQLKISADDGEPLAIIYLAAQPEYLNDDKVFRKWSTKLKRREKTPLVESAIHNLKIIELQSEIRKRTPKGFISPFRYQKVYEKQKKPTQKLCKAATSGFKVWRQNGTALRALSVCNLHPYGNNNAYEAYKFLVASLAVGYTTSVNEIDNLAMKLGNTDTVRESFKQGFQYSGVDINQSGIEYLNKHISRFVDRSNQINARRRNQVVPLNSGTTKTLGSSTGFLSHESENGFSKICYYDVLGDTKALNRSSTDICPLSHKF